MSARSDRRGILAFDKREVAVQELDAAIGRVRKGDPLIDAPLAAHERRCSPAASSSDARITDELSATLHATCGRWLRSGFELTLMLCPARFVNQRLLPELGPPFADATRVKITGGIELYGRVRAGDGAWRATRFVYVGLWPLVPLGSVRGREGSEQPDEKVPLDAFSVMAAYFQYWGFTFAVVVGLIVAKQLTSISLANNWPASAPIVVVLMGFSLTLLTTVIASWFWIGRRSSLANGKRTLLMLMTMALLIGPMSWLQVRGLSESLRSVRAEREQLQRAIDVASVQAKEQLKTDDKTRAEMAALAKAHLALDPQKLSVCDDAVLASLQDDNNQWFTFVRSSEEAYFAASLAADVDVPRGNEWLVSAILRLPQPGGPFTEGTLRWLASQRLLLVFHLEPKAGNGRGMSWFSIHERMSGTALCGAKVDAKGLALDKPQGRDAFVAAIEKSLARISKRLKLVLD